MQQSIACLRVDGQQILVRYVRQPAELVDVVRYGVKRQVDDVAVPRAHVAAGTNGKEI